MRAKIKNDRADMTLDHFLNYSGWVVGVAGFAYSIWTNYNAKSRLVITDMRAGMRALGTVSSGKRFTDIVSISIKLENKGPQTAKCTGLVHFARAPAVPLHVQVRGHAQQSDDPFLIDGKEEMDLVGAWDLQPGGFIGMGGVPYADFVRDYLPATAVITFGKREVKKVLTEREVVAAHHVFEQQSYRMGA